MTHSCLKTKQTEQQDIFKNFHSSPKRYQRRNRRERYYEGSVLCIKIGENIFRYPPKGGVIIFNKDKSKILMVRNNYHPYVECQKWGFPKGHCNHNERYCDCATRELKEETGLNIEVKTDSKFITINNSRYYIYCMTNEIINQAQPQDTNEINKVDWQPTTDIVGKIKMNKESVVLFTKKLELAQKIAQNIEL